jgi:hypothetical protein
VSGEEKWGQAPAKQRNFLGFAWDGRSQSPFFLTIHHSPLTKLGFSLTDGTFTVTFGSLLQLAVTDQALTMDNRFWIGMSLIVSGMLCILAVLGILAFIIQQVFRQYADLSMGFRGVGDWVVALLVLFGLAGIGMIAVGVRIGIRK